MVSEQDGHLLITHHFKRLFLALLLVLGYPAQAVDTAPDVTSLSYEVIRKGSDIGTHTVRFRPGESGTTAVEITAKIRVKLAFITLFRLDHTAHEEWRDGQLVSMSCETRRNSKSKDVDLWATGDHYTVEIAGDTISAPADLVPSSFTMPDFWIDSGTRDFSLLDTLTGDLFKSRLFYDSRQTLVMDDQAYDTRHYRITNLETGDLSHEFWVDDDGHLVQAHIMTHKGETLTYRHITDSSDT